MKKVKLSPERIDEYTVHHVFAGSKHLPKCYAEGRTGYYRIYRYEADDRGWNEPLCYDTFHSLKYVRQWIAGYDERYEKEQQELAEQRAAEEAAYQARIQREDALQALYTSDADVAPREFTIGQRFHAKFARMNKNCTIGEYARLCEANDDFRLELCEVEAVADLTSEQYDLLCANLMDSELCAQLGLATGGSNSDADLPEDWDYRYATKEEMDLWRAHCYNVVTVVTAPQRRPFVTNGSGYQYARYVGLELTA